MSRVVIRTDKHGRGTIAVDGVDISRITRSAAMYVSPLGGTELELKLLPDELDFEGEATVLDDRRVVLRLEGNDR